MTIKVQPLCSFSTFEHGGRLPTRCYVSLILSVQTIIFLTKSGRALDYRLAIDSYIMRNRDLHLYELSDEDWESITMVSSWLKSFRSATTQMSSTKTPMLSTTLTIFRGLQDDIKTILCGLPAAVSPTIKMGLIDVHEKLSEYYYKYDESPFYTWAACKS
jgi:hypothetical protein